VRTPHVASCSTRAWRPTSCSATCGVRTPAPRPAGVGSLPRRRAGRCCSMTFSCCERGSSISCCGSWMSNCTGGWGATGSGRVGSDRDAPVGCRLVFGMCEHPDDLVAQGKMLKDVRYRLEHCIVRVPPLEERREEIVLLAQHFLARCPAETRVTHGPQRFTKE